MNNLNIPFYVRYDEWIDIHSLSWIWESIIWLEELLIKLVKTSWLDDEKISVKIDSVEWWCITFCLNIDIIVAINIFKDLKDFYDILTFLTPDINLIWKEAIELHRKINDFASDNPVDYDLVKFLLTNWTLIWILKWFIKDLIKILPSQKDRLTTNYEWYSIPKSIAIKSQKIIKSNAFKKTLSPFIDEKINNIEFSTDKTFKKSTKINSNNFWDYLWKDQQILPEWRNWDVKEIQWKFVSWQVKKGKSLSFRINWLPKFLRDFTCYPDDSMEINDFTEYLSKDNLLLKVEVNRISLYTKPKLIIHDISETILNLELE